MRTDRILHNHTFQLEPDEARRADCPACRRIHWGVMKSDPTMLPQRFGYYGDRGQYIPTSF